eukprot:s5937_g5.t1
MFLSATARGGVGVSGLRTGFPGCTRGACTLLSAVNIFLASKPDSSLRESSGPGTIAAVAFIGGCLNGARSEAPQRLADSRWFRPCRSQGSACGFCGALLVPGFAGVREDGVFYSEMGREAKHERTCIPGTHA